VGDLIARWNFSEVGSLKNADVSLRGMK